MSLSSLARFHRAPRRHIAAPSLWLALLLLPLPGVVAPAAAAPHAVASILPLHSLLAGVMQGVGTPALLIPPGQSPHKVDLRPSQARELAGADFVVWVGEDLETGLRKAVATLPAGAHIVTLSDDPALTTLPRRENAAWMAHHHGDDHDGDAHPEHDAGHDADHEDDHDAADHEGMHGDHDGDHDAHHDEHHDEHDPHLWLAPAQAAGIVRTLGADLARIDPEHAEAYARNVAAMLERLDALDRELEARLAAVRDRPYLVFHDAYQYFERRYGLDAVGSVTINAEREPGARHVAALRTRIHATGARCVFAEPQFEPRLVRTLVADTDARVGELDPIGRDLTPGPDAYFALMRQLADHLIDCLDR